MANKFSANSKKLISVILSIAMIISLFSSMSGLSAFAIDNSVEGAPVVSETPVEEAVSEAYPSTYPVWHCECGNIWADPSHNNDEEAPTTDLHYVNGEGKCKNSGSNGCNGTLLKWSPITQATYKGGTLNAGGNFYLTENVNADSGITPANEVKVNLDLNGFTYTYTGTSRVITFLERHDTEVSVSDNKGTGVMCASKSLETGGYAFFYVTKNDTNGSNNKLRVYSGTLKTATKLNDAGNTLFAQYYGVKSGITGSECKNNNIYIFGGKIDASAPVASTAKGALMNIIKDNCLYMYGGEIDASGITTTGNGVIFAGDVARVFGGKIIGGTAALGGAIYSESTLNMGTNGTGIPVEIVGGASTGDDNRSSAVYQKGASYLYSGLTVKGNMYYTDSNGNLIYLASDKGTYNIDNIYLYSSFVSNTLYSRKLAFKVNDSGANTTVNPASHIGITVWGYNRTTTGVEGVRVVSVNPSAANVGCIEVKNDIDGEQCFYVDTNGDVQKSVGGKYVCECGGTLEGTSGHTCKPVFYHGLNEANFSEFFKQNGTNAQFIVKDSAKNHFILTDDIDLANTDFPNMNFMASGTTTSYWLDLNGKTFTFDKGANSMFSSWGAGCGNVSDSTPGTENDGKVVCNSRIYNISNTSTKANDNAGLNIYGGNFTYNSANAGFNVNAGVVNIYGGTFKQAEGVTNANNVGIVALNSKDSVKGTLKVYGGELYGTKNAEGKGISAVKSYSCEVYQYGGTIYGGDVYGWDNSSNTYSCGGAIYSSGITRIFGGDVIGGSAKLGGAIYCTSTLNMGTSGTNLPVNIIAGTSTGDNNESSAVYANAESYLYNGLTMTGNATYDLPTTDMTRYVHFASGNGLYNIENIILAYGGAASAKVRLLKFDSGTAINVASKIGITVKDYEGEELVGRKVADANGNNWTSNCRELSINGGKYYITNDKDDKGGKLAAGSYRCVCGGTAIGAKNHTCSTCLYKALTAENFGDYFQGGANKQIQLKASGYYYLDADIDAKDIKVTASSGETLSNGAYIYIVNKTLGIDLNGHKFSFKGTTGYLGSYGSSSAPVYISDSVGTGSFEGGNNGAYGGLMTATQANSSVTIFGGTFIPTGAATLIRSASKSPATSLINIYGGNFTAPNKEPVVDVYGTILNVYGGLFKTDENSVNDTPASVIRVGGSNENYTSTSTANIYGGTFTGHQGINGDGKGGRPFAVIGRNSSVKGVINIYGGEIFGGDVTGFKSQSTKDESNGNLRGGVLAVGGNVEINVNGGTIKGGKAYSGGAISVLGNSTLNINGGTIEGGYASANGGNIYTWADTNQKTEVYMTGGTVKNGTTDASVGSNFNLGKNVDMTVSGGVIEQTEEGDFNSGSIYVNQSKLTVEDGAVIRGGKGANGGNINVTGTTTITGELVVNGGTIENGWATAYGGNINAGANTQITINDAIIKNGVASVRAIDDNPTGEGVGTKVAQGGNISLQGGAKATIKAGQILNGTSYGQAGNIYITGATTEVQLGSEDGTTELLIDNGAAYRVYNSLTSLTGGVGGNIYCNSKLDIYDGVTIQNGSTNMGGSGNIGGVADSTNITMYGGVIKNGAFRNDSGRLSWSDGGNVYIYYANGSTFDMQGGLVTNDNEALKGSGVRINQGVLKISGDATIDETSQLFVSKQEEEEKTIDATIDNFTGTVYIGGVFGDILTMDADYTDLNGEYQYDGKLYFLDLTEKDEKDSWDNKCTLDAETSRWVLNLNHTKKQDAVQDFLDNMVDADGNVTAADLYNKGYYVAVNSVEAKTLLEAAGVNMEQFNEQLEVATNYNSMLKVQMFKSNDTAVEAGKTKYFLVGSMSKLFAKRASEAGFTFYYTTRSDEKEYYLDGNVLPTVTTSNVYTTIKDVDGTELEVVKTSEDLSDYFFVCELVLDDSETVDQNLFIRASSFIQISGQRIYGSESSFAFEDFIVE